MKIEAIKSKAMCRIALPGKHRGMFGSSHDLECYYLAVMYTYASLESGSLCVQSIEDLWKHAKQSVHGDSYGPLVLADLKGSDPKMAENALADVRPAAICVRDSYKNIWDCVRSRTLGSSLGCVNIDSRVDEVLTRVIEHFLDSGRVLFAPDQENSLLWSLISLWEDFVLESEQVRNLQQCQYDQIQNIGGTSTGIAYRCSNIYGYPHRIRYTAAESAIADQQIMKWVTQFTQSNNLNS